MRRIALLPAVAILFAAAACGGDGEPARARPSSPVTVRVLEPGIGAVITGETFTVRLALDGGTIVEEASRDLEPTTEGHVHVSVDGRVISQTYGLTQDIDTPEPGSHLLQIEFVAKDHGPFDPRVLQTVPFEVRG